MIKILSLVVLGVASLFAAANPTYTAKSSDCCCPVCDCAKCACDCFACPCADDCCCAGGACTGCGESS